MTEGKLGYLTIGCVEVNVNTEEVTRRGDLDTFILKKQIARVNQILHLAKIARPDEGDTIGTRYFLAKVEVDLQEPASIILSVLTPAANAWVVESFLTSWT